MGSRRLEGSQAAAGLGVGPGGLEAAGCGRGPGGHRRRGEPVGQQGPSGGIAALRHRKPPGGPSRLSDGQRGQLPGLLGRGPAAYGFCGEVWTRRRVAQVIEQEFGVSYDPSQVGRILKSCGFSLQKPALRATQRDEDAIRDCRDHRFPDLKKRPQKAGRKALVGESDSASAGDLSQASIQVGSRW